MGFLLLGHKHHTYMNPCATVRTESGGVDGGLRILLSILFSFLLLFFGSVVCD